ncbi:cob(I)yrinic acid a,c-diamide adenosyltransferase [Candidatus Kaiserbacteria bacterium]|nr:cob(I)yrinic acid a,c-diamide adenosyltransferase [Candidatus Kaiserbacteria bacterium]
MLFTGKGDDGTTGTFGCDQRISKSSSIAEALGSLDEVNSFLGLCKVLGKESGFKISGNSFESLVHTIQGNLFIIQAELAGADKTIGEEKVRDVEEIVNAIEKELPPISTFFISGGTELAARFDVARTFARRAERRVIGVTEEGSQEVGKWTLAYLNRLSSLLYALARLSNHFSGIVDESPSYT